MRDLMSLAVLVFACKGFVDWATKEEGKVPFSDKKLFPKEKSEGST